MSNLLPYLNLKNSVKYSAWWLSWVLLQAGLLVYLEIDPLIALKDSFINNLLIAMAAFVAINTFRFYQPGPRDRFHRLLWSAGITFLCMYAFQKAMIFLHIDDVVYIQFLEKSMPFRYVVALLIIAFVTLISWLWFQLKDQRETIERKSDAERLLKEAELAGLRLQLQPHFLFNSLNSINALIGSKPEEARKMIQQLSDFLRGTLKKDMQQQNLLSGELEHLKLYLDIEKVRFGHRLHINSNASDEALNMELPALLLQPVVENAIKFGLYDNTGDITINLKAQSLKGYLHITIDNPFDPATSSSQKGEGFGLSSVKRRLHLLYARQDLINTYQKENIFFTEIKIPQQK